VHIRSGSGTTDDGGALTGLGNLIIGYNEEPLGFAAGERAGSHNLSIGTGHRYLNFGGLVAGRRNTVSGVEASVSGGLNNTATGNFASVSGGVNNAASGNNASVSGGFSNTASGNDASVSGGSGNTASGLQASVSGGRSCKLTSTNAWGVGDSPITAGCPTTN